jgi:hypothetical protein
VYGSCSVVAVVAVVVAEKGRERVGEEGGRGECVRLGVRFM